MDSRGPPYKALASVKGFKEPFGNCWFARARGVLFSAAKATRESFSMEREAARSSRSSERGGTFLTKEQREMPSERDKRNDLNAGSESGEGTHGGLAIGRTTGMGAGINRGGTPGASESGGSSSS